MLADAAPQESEDLVVQTLPKSKWDELLRCCSPLISWQCSFLTVVPFFRCSPWR